MVTRDRMCRIVEGLLIRLGGLITLLLAARPRWGLTPNDFYLGYPKYFYITQSDVSNPYVSVPWFLFDVTLYGAPVFAVVFLVLYGVRKIVPLAQSSEDMPH